MARPAVSGEIALAYLPYSRRSEGGMPTKEDIVLQAANTLWVSAAMSNRTAFYLAPGGFLCPHFVVFSSSATRRLITRNMPNSPAKIDRRARRTGVTHLNPEFDGSWIRGGELSKRARSCSDEAQGPCIWASPCTVLRFLTLVFR